MKKTGAARQHRLLALLLAAVMLLTAVPALANALEGWENISVSVVWTDEGGNAWQYPAVQVPAEAGVSHGWWVTMPQEALGDQLSLQIVHPDPAYTYWLTDWSLMFQWTDNWNAMDLSDAYAQYVGYSLNGAPQVSQMQDCMKLYVSTLDAPFALPEGSLPGGAVMLPDGYEGFLPGDAELITPPPAQSAPAYGVVTVYYQHMNGQLLDTQDVTLQPGTHTLWPESTKVGGLNLVGDTSTEVTVYADGSTDLASVTFLYEDAYVAPAEAVIQVLYVHENGSILDEETRTLTAGTHTITPRSDRVGSYELVSDDAVQVTVDASGWTDVASISFYYKDVYVAPVEATIPVYYYHQDGQLLDTRYVTLGEGTHTLYPESNAVAGLELVSDGVQTVTVYANGSASVQNAVFLYKDAYVAPVTGEVTVMYLMEDYTVIDQQVITLAQGQQTVWPESRKVGDLTLVSDAQVSVYVDGGGSVSPNPVQFFYRQPVQQVTEAQVKVYIYDTMGNEILPARTIPLAPGVHTIEAPAGYETPDYELISEAVLTVTVYEDGSWSPSGDELSFWYRPALEEVEPTVRTATITLRYLDSRGYDIADQQQLTLGEGTHVVSPDPAHVPAGYTIFAGTESQTVKVTNGSANYPVVSFYFEKAAEAPKVFSVTVHYYDTLNNEIAPRQTLQLESGVHWIQAAPENLPAGYELATESAFQLTVRADGSLDRSPEDVGFWYSPVQVEAKKAVISIRYVDGNGRTLAGPYSQELEGGQSYVVTPDGSVLSDAYDVSRVEPVTVTVSADGYASPPVVSFVAELRRAETDIPVGQPIHRYGIVNSPSVAFRSEPYTKGGNKTVLRRMQTGSVVYMVETEYNTAGEEWTEVIIDNRSGYIQTQFLDVLTQSASDVYAQSVGATPVPTFTPVPTPTPTEGFVEFITPVPTATVPDTGYAVLRNVTALRTGTGSSEMTIDWLQTEELVIVAAQVQNSYTGEAWSYVQTLDGLNGYVPAANLRQVSQAEADWRIDAWQQQNASPAPTQLITNTPEPMQVQGYALTTVNSAPLRRMPSEQSWITDNLPYNTVVYITGQTYADGFTWHNVAVDGANGYLRSDLVRLMTDYEETLYLNSLTTPTPTATPTSQPYNQNSMSSYGYVTTDKVNFRTAASKSSSVIRSLNTYAMATVLGQETVGNVTWYRVRYENSTGYIHGDYFKPMTWSEYIEFYNGGLYAQGLKNNGTQADPDNDGYTGTGGQVSEEDWAVDDMYGSGSAALPSFAPYLPPVGTVPPIAATTTPTPTLEPLPGYVTQGATATPVPGGNDQGNASDDLPLPGGTGSVTYPTQNDGGSNVIVWIIVILLLVMVGGGAIALVQHQRKRRKIAMKAAQRRAQQARNAGESPYARQSGAAQSRMGSYPTYGQTPAQPRFPQQQSGSSQNYWQQTPPTAPASAETERPHARTTAESAGNAEQTGRRVGRRTAYQQSLSENRQNGNDESL